MCGARPCRRTVTAPSPARRRASLWQMHHRVALEAPKLGELVMLRCGDLVPRSPPGRAQSTRRRSSGRHRRRRLSAWPTCRRRSCTTRPRDHAPTSCASVAASPPGTTGCATCAATRSRRWTSRPHRAPHAVGELLELRSAVAPALRARHHRRRGASRARSAGSTSASARATRRLEDLGERRRSVMTDELRSEYDVDAAAHDVVRERQVANT